MGKIDINERRQYERANRILSIRHRLHKRNGKLFHEPWYFSMTQNMSYNGILFSSSAVYKLDDTLELEVVLSGVLDIFKGYGKVIRVLKKESGVFYSTAVELVDLKINGRNGKKGISSKRHPMSLPKATIKRRK